ncbi:hypothetical protein J6590_089952 [Homalodisca vitripennis]|nr:hypothetical protein J6590_089952 [Homalodisca vitripennis]
MVAGEKCICGGSCSKAVLDRHNAIMCYGICKKWWHIACASISKPQYDHFKNISSMPGIKWYCVSCLPNAVIKQSTESASGTDLHPSNESDCSAILNVVVTELEEITKNNLSLSKRLSELENENNVFRTQLNEIMRHFHANSKIETSTNESKEPNRSENGSGKESCSNTSNSVINPEIGMEPNLSEYVNEITDDKIKTPSYVDIVKTRTSKRLTNRICQDVNNKNVEASLGSNSDSDTTRTETSLVASDDVSPSKTENKLNKDWQAVGPRRKNVRNKIGKLDSEVRNGLCKANLGLSKNRVSPYPESSKYKKKHSFIIGTGDSVSSSLLGAKKAWFHLGKVAIGTSEEDVQCFVSKAFPNISFSVEKLENKGVNKSFKLGVDFLHKDKVMDCTRWPRNVTLKRFLFRNTQTLSVT